MDEKPDKIVQHIESKRDELGRNLDELQNKVRETTDWRVQFDRHPYILMSAAMGGGMLLSSMMGGSSSRSRDYGSRRTARLPQTGSYYLNESSSPMPSYQSSGSMQHFSQPPSQHFESSGYQQQRQKAWTMFENIKGALIGLAAAKAQDYLNEMLPGFREHFREVVGQSGSGNGMGQQQRHEFNQSWNEPNRPQNWGQGVSNQPSWGDRPFQGQGSHERWSGQQETWRQSPGSRFEGQHNAPGQQHFNQPQHSVQGQWPQERNQGNERNWERDREHQHQNPGSFDPSGFRR